MMGGINNAIADHERERAERAGAGTAWAAEEAPAESTDVAD